VLARRGVDGVANVLVFAVLNFAARHRYKIAFRPLYNADVVNHKAILNGHRRNGAHFVVLFAENPNAYV